MSLGYPDQALTTQEATTGFSSTTSSDFSGFGPYVGGEADYAFGGGFSVFGRVATSLLYGTRDDALQDINTVNQTFRQSTDLTTLVLEFALGLNWQKDFSDTVSLNLAASYELQQWFNALNGGGTDTFFGESGTANTNSADLTLSGFVLGVNLLFELP